MSAMALLGTTVTTNTGRTVLVEDTYPKGRVCGKTTDGEFVVLSLDFVEQDMPEENRRWLNLPPIAPEVLKAPDKVQPTEVFVQEVICGGPEAAGGGCGAPLGVSQVYQPVADDTSFKLTDFSEHNDSEVAAHLISARDGGYLRLRLVLRECCECRIH